MTNQTTNRLIELLTHPDGTQRRQAALQLGASGDPAAAPALVERLRAETPGCGVHEDLTWATVQHIDTALPDVLAMLGDADPHVRRSGAHVLSKVGDPAHADALAALVADADADVAIKAYRAVANSGGPDAATVLAGRLGDGDALQRDALTNALATLGAASVPALVEALASPRVEVRAHAADALGHLGDEASGAVDTLTVAASDADADVRLAAVAALGQLGEASEQALAGLTGASDPRVAAVARRLSGR